MSAFVQPPVSSYSRTVTCVLINLAATPGLGSFLCGRRIVGLGQLAFSVTGFCLIMIWMCRSFYAEMLRQMDEPVAPLHLEWMWRWGALLFGAAWLWSLATSISLLRAAKKTEAAASSSVPPRIAEAANGSRLK